MSDEDAGKVERFASVLFLNVTNSQSHKTKRILSMGMDLALIPVETTKPVSDFFLLQRDYNLSGQLGLVYDGGPPPVVKPKSYGKTVTIEGDEGLQTQSEDCYGTPLTFITPVELKKLTTKSTENRRIIDKLSSLPPDTPIVLYWS